MLKRATRERHSGLIHKVRDNVLRSLWVCAYAVILLIFRLIQKIESPNASQRRA